MYLVVQKIHMILYEIMMHYYRMSLQRQNSCKGEADAAPCD